MAVKPKKKNYTLQSVINQMMGMSLNPQQMRKQARRETNIAVQDSLRNLRTTMQRERERVLREQYAQGAWAGLLRGYGAEGSPESQSIKDAYARAAGLSEAEAKGFIAPTIGQQQANVNTGQQTAATLAGLGTDIGTAQPGVNAGVLNYLAGLPRGTFAAQAEAAAKGLGRAGAEAGAGFAFREAELGQRLRDITEEYQLGVGNINAKRPGMLTEALTALRESKRSDLGSIANLMYLQNTLGKTEAELTGTYKGKLTPEERTRRAGVQAQRAATAAAAERVAISRMNAKTSRMNAKISQQKANLERSAQQAEITGDRSKVEADFRSNAENWVREILSIDKKKGRPTAMPPNRQTLINGVFRLYARPLLQYGFTQQQLALWAAQVVNAFPAKWWNATTYKGGAKTGGKGGAAPSAADILGG